MDTNLSRGGWSMTDIEETTSFVSAISFEERCSSALVDFIEAGGTPTQCYVVSFIRRSELLESNIQKFKNAGVVHHTSKDRFDSRALWNWCWETVEKCSDDVVIDISCFPREVLAMLLFGLSVKRDKLSRVRVAYTSPMSYVSQDQSKEEQDRKLSNGIKIIRTILGYPGQFSSDRKRHLIALAGHESERLVEVISFVEPTKISLSNEDNQSGTVSGATAESEKVKAKVRESVGLPEYSDVVFYADSIEKTFASLTEMLQVSSGDNVALVAMNTKLSFVGAALCALKLRHLRMVYAVPLEYNENYSVGVKPTAVIDVTDLLMQAETTLVPQNQD
jgi:hypothetical protein